MFVHKPVDFKFKNGFVNNGYAWQEEILAIASCLDILNRRHEHDLYDFLTTLPFEENVEKDSIFYIEDYGAFVSEETMKCVKYIATMILNLPCYVNSTLREIADVEFANQTYGFPGKMLYYKFKINGAESNKLISVDCMLSGSFRCVIEIAEFLSPAKVKEVFKMSDKRYPFISAKMSYEEDNVASITRSFSLRSGENRTIITNEYLNSPIIYSNYDGKVVKEFMENNGITTDNITTDDLILIQEELDYKLKGQRI